MPVALDVQDKIGRVSRVFGTFRGSMFCDRNLSLTTKRMVYCSMVLEVLLYGAESWAIKEQPSGRSKHYIIDVCAAHWVLVELSKGLGTLPLPRFGMETSMKDLLTVRGLLWLGHQE